MPQDRHPLRPRNRLVTPSPTPRGLTSKLLGCLTAAAVAMDEAPRAQRYAEAMMSWARFTFFTGRPAAGAYASALAAARTEGDVVSEVECLSGLAHVALRESRWDDVRRHAQEASLLARSTGDDSLQRVPVHMLAAVARMTGDYGGETPLHREHRDR